MAVIFSPVRQVVFGAGGCRELDDDDDDDGVDASG